MHIVLLLLLFMNACAQPSDQNAAIVQGVALKEKPKSVTAQDEIPALQNKAQQGDVTAQYMLGRALCCANPNRNDADIKTRNQQATFWLCQAAANNSEAALFKLGEIYSGDQFNVPSLEDYKINKQTSIRLPLVLGLMWYQLAATNHQADAIGAAIRLKNRMGEAEIAASQLLLQKWREVPCLWGDTVK